MLSHRQLRTVLGVLVGSSCLTLAFFLVSRRSASPILAIIPKPPPPPTNASHSQPFPLAINQTQPASLGIPHPTLIYVLSLPSRPDRRRAMDTLARALGITWTYVDAVGKDEDVVGRIIARVGAQRSGTPREPLTLAQNESTIPPYHPSLPPSKLLTRSVVACWYSHLRVMRLAARVEREDEVAVVLEDDVDVEWDVRERVGALWGGLPVGGWDVVFLGHCWSNEAHHPPLASTTGLTKNHTSTLHPSHAPKCTHAYLLSRPGARRLLALLSRPHFAYSRAIDQAMAWLVKTKRLRCFSVVPSLVVQRKDGPSDVQGGNGSGWREGLARGVLKELDV
jgi:GR25 family glycosyltransferase involved in LPS biosynthesis